MAQRLLIGGGMNTTHVVTTLLVFAACTADRSLDVEVGIDPSEASTSSGKADGVSAVPDVRCDDAPAVGSAAGFRHTHNQLTAALGGGGKHRGIDLVATASDVQVISGEVAYGLLDDGIDDEDIDLWACRAGAWVSLGTVRSKEHGAFRLELHGSDRLPIGMRDMFLSVRGDRSGARFLALVAPPQTSLAVSDIDGTLTSFEAADIGAALGIDIGIHDSAPEAWRALAARGNIPVYVTARSRHSTERTREWLAGKGMPRGPVRLADHVLLPGSATIDYKTKTLAAFAGFEIAYGVGNRASDIAAYTAAGVPASHIAIKLPEFTLEVRDALDHGDAVGFDNYADLLATFDSAQ